MSGVSSPSSLPVLHPAPKMAVLVSRFNASITSGLKEGAVKWLAEHGVHSPDILEAPGAFELPLLAQTLAKSGRYEAIICLGCVIKGDTAHFEFISLGAATGIMAAQLATGVPIAFGILTAYTGEQARIRSANNSDNKGREAAAAAYEALAFLRKHSARP